MNGGKANRRVLYAGLILSCVWPALSAGTEHGNRYVRLPIGEGTDQLFEPVAFRAGAGRSAHSHVGQIVEDRAGFLWMGTEDGLKRYDGYRFRDFRPDPKNPNSLRGVSVNALFIDGAGQIWVAADDYLDRFDPATEAFTHYPSATGASEGPVASINQDRNGTIWLATGRGLTRLDPATGKTVRF